MSRIRGIFAWIAAISAVAAVYFVLSFLCNKFGVPVMFDVDPQTVSYGRGAEGEISSITTAAGWGVNILSVLAGISVWMLVRGESFTNSGDADFRGALAGSLVLLVGGIPLGKIFKGTEGVTGFVGNVLEFGLFAAAVYVGLQVIKSKRPA